MKRFILAQMILLILLLISCEKNNTQKETVKKEVQQEIQSIVISPKGNQLFTESVKLRYLQNVDGYVLTSAAVSSCENSGGGIENPDDDKKITKITNAEDRFLIEFTVVENCCSEFLCEAEIVDETTLNILYHPFGNHCSCECKFEMKYTFTVNTSLEAIGEKLTEITHVQFNSDTSSKVTFKHKKE
ncbi:hypothetical protein [Kordia jejudonensis]|uniref:hypothetical protein n=1 Tax=Kordia jejudonensis TaxID=1348245 RepID=UPI0006294F28|nr:hypothetical protein [Kordia jejudonensis]